MTPTSTSSLWHFLCSLQVKIFMPNCIMTFLIHLIIMPLVPLSVPYFFFISSANVFPLDLSSRISARSIPLVGRPVICMISSTVMGTGLSSHTSPPCVTTNSCLMHAMHIGLCQSVVSSTILEFLFYPVQLPTGVAE
jgi:hypothetical protein